MIDIVVPVYNEMENLEELYNQIVQASRSWNEEFAVIFVDDGSTDESLEIIKQIHRRDTRFKAISLARNFGHQTAISAGLKYAIGDVVAVMDADLQDPPEFLERLLTKWREGYQVVYAIRQKRKINRLKRAGYWLFYRLLARVAAIEIPPDTGDFCVMDRKVVQILNTMPERNRFNRGLRAWVGFRQIGVPYDRRMRFAGDIKYTFGKLLKLAFDGVISFSYKPLQIFGYFGFLVAIGSLSLLALFTLAKVFHWRLTPLGLGNIPGYFALLAVILFIGGIQLIGFGLFGEYLGRVFDEVKQRPLFLIKESVGLEHDPKEDENRNLRY